MTTKNWAYDALKKSNLIFNHALEDVWQIPELNYNSIYMRYMYNNSLTIEGFDGLLVDTLMFNYFLFNLKNSGLILVVSFYLLNRIPKSDSSGHSLANQFIHKIIDYTVLNMAKQSEVAEKLFIIPHDVFKKEELNNFPIDELNNTIILLFYKLNQYEKEKEK